MKEPSPLFSVVIPTFNRPTDTVRAVRSCLKQGFPDQEIIVVDDGSTEGPFVLPEDLREQNGAITVLRHFTNRGVCAARNTGVAAANGEWIVFLDSDDELFAGALFTMESCIRSTDEGVSRFAFGYLRDDGQAMPNPAPPRLLNYEAYLRWANQAKLTDMCFCTRRKTFESIRFPEKRVFELSYHLAFNQHFVTECVPEIAGIVHTEAANRTSNVSVTAHIKTLLSRAEDSAEDVDQILQQHGAALASHAPDLNGRLHFKRAWLCLLCRCGSASQLVREYRATYPGDLRATIVFAIGTFNPVLLAGLVGAKRRIRM